MFVFQPSHVYCPAKVFHFVYYDRRDVAVRVSNTYRLTSQWKNIKKNGCTRDLAYGPDWSLPQFLWYEVVRNIPFPILPFLTEWLVPIHAWDWERDTVKSSVSRLRTQHTAMKPETDFMYFSSAWTPLCTGLKVILDTCM